MGGGIIYVVVFETVLLILAIAAVVALNRRIKDKNRRLVRIHYRIVKYREKLNTAANKVKNLEQQLSHQPEAGEVTITGKESNRELLYKLDQLVRRDALYKNAEVDRDYVCQLLHIDRNRLSQIFREECQMHTFTSYMNGLRVDEACRLLVEKPAYAIRAVADEAGFNTVRRFQTVFKELVGVTPLEFREAHLSNDQPLTDKESMES